MSSSSYGKDCHHARVVCMVAVHDMMRHLRRGTEDLEMKEQPRPQFRGVLRVNKETEKEILVHPSQSSRLARIFLGIIICFSLVTATGLAAFLASQLKFKYNPTPKCRFVPKLGVPLWDGNDQTSSGSFDELENQTLWNSCEHIQRCRVGGQTDDTRLLAGCDWCNKKETYFTKRADFLTRSTGFSCKEYAYGCYPTAQEFMSFIEKFPVEADNLGIVGSTAVKVNRSAMDEGDLAVGYEIAKATSEFECYNIDRMLSGMDERYATAEWFFKWPEGTSQVDKLKWGYLSSFLNLVIIQVAGLTFEALARGMNEWENHRTQTQYEDMLILKNFLFQFINNYFVLFYIGYLRQIEIMGSAQVCSNGSCLETLQTQLTVVFTVKTFGLQAVELMKPVIMRYVKGWKLGRRRKALMQKTSDAVMNVGNKVLPGDIKGFVGVDNDVLLARKHRAERAKMEEEAARAFMEANNKQVDKSGKIVLVHSEVDEAPVHIREAAQVEGISVKEKIERTNAEAECFLEDYGSTFDDFNEMVIQYGYVALFAPAYSLAPLLALLNNIIEIRVDAIKLCYATQRPQWKPQADIGSWYTVLNILGFFAVLTNASMIAFVGYKLVPHLYTNQDNDTLIQGGINARFMNTQLWMYAVAIEHAVMLTRVLISLGMPRVPTWLTDAHELLEYRTKRMLTAKEIEADTLESAEYLKKLENRDQIIGYEKHKSNTSKFREQTRELE
eukprot:SAG31_NODE_914_length_11058_cov_13.316270_6_plen_726_part_00